MDVNIQQLSILTSVSLFEAIGLCAAASISLALLPLLKRRGVYRPLRIGVLLSASFLLIFALYSTAVSLTLSYISPETSSEAPAPSANGGTISSDQNTISSESLSPIEQFYAGPFGYFLGGMSLLIIKLSAIALPAYLLFLVKLRRKKKKEPISYIKRCSRCGHIFPPETQPHSSCPYCGAYWKYEK